MRYLTIVLAVMLAAQAPQTRAPIPSFKEVIGPGAVFGALQRLPADEDLANFKYLVKEYFVSGTAQGQPYTTRILVRRPADAKKFSGIVLAEPMHPTGNSWMFHFLHTYAMSQGHISLEIVTGSVPLFTQANGERYKPLAIGPAQANEIIAVGALRENGGTRPTRRPAHAKDDSHGDFGVGCCTDGISARAHDLPLGRNEADLRRFPANEHRRAPSQS
jgi:hypothetical protein